MICQEILLLGIDPPLLPYIGSRFHLYFFYPVRLRFRRSSKIFPFVYLFQVYNQHVHVRACESLADQRS